MPRRSSTRLRGVAAGGSSSAGASDAENGSYGASSTGHALLCPPLPPSPGKRKTRSPVEEIEGGPSAPSAVRCTSLAFQSPKKKASGDRGGGSSSLNAADRLALAPYEKENDLAAGVGTGSGSNGMVGTLAFGEGAQGQGFLQSRGGAGATVAGSAGSFRLSAFSAFSHATKASSTSTAHSSTREGAKRRTREESSAPGRPSPAPAGQTSPHHLAGMAKPSPLPFLLAPANLTNSPELGNKTGSRRTRRTSRLGRSRDSSSSSSNGSASPALTPVAPSVQWKSAAAAGGAAGQHGVGSSADFTPLPPRGRTLAGTGCAAGRRRATSHVKAASDARASSPTPEQSSPVGDSAGACRGGCQSPYVSEPDQSPHRSPIHRLTESLQKWAPGSRSTSRTGALASSERGRRRNSDSARSGGHLSGSSNTGVGAGNARAGVGASWSGQELRRTLEQERIAASATAGQTGTGGGHGHRRTRSAHTTEEVMYPQDRFRVSPAYSPISPASSAASVNLAGAEDRVGDRIRGFTFGGGEGGTPPSAGRPWRSSPNRASKDSGAAGSALGTPGRFTAVRMASSWSDDENGSPSRTAMRLAFSPGGGGKGSSEGGPSTAGSAETVVAAAAAASKASSTPYQGPFSPVKGKRPADGNAFGGGRAASSAGVVASPSGKSGFSLGSPAPSRISRREFLAADSPEEHSLHSVRDLMDEGTDDEEDDSGSGRLFRRRRRRPRPEVALRALEMPDALDVTVVDGQAEGAGGSATTSSGGSMMMTIDDDDEVTVTSNETTSAATAARAAAGKHTPNPLNSPATVAAKGFGGSTGGAGAFASGGCPTACPRWEYPSAGDSTAPLESTHLDSDVATATHEDSWIRGRGSKGKDSVQYIGVKDDSIQSSSICGSSNSPHEVQDLSVLSRENSVMALGISGISGVSGVDMSGISDTSVSFVKSRPIPDQAAFSSTRISKGGAGAPLSPTAGGGPATGPPGPLCVTPRKSVMRCPPTPQRTPTWDGLEDSLLLEGAGSGGRGAGASGVGNSGGAELGSSIRRSLRSHGKVAGGGVASGSSAGSSADGSLIVDAGLANSFSIGGARTASLLAEAADSSSKAGVAAHVNGVTSDQGSHANARAGAGGRGGRGRGGKERVSNGCGATGGVGDSAATGDRTATGCGGRGVGTRGAGTGGDGTLGFKHDFVQMGPIGEGGFSVVWKVRARGTGRLYAIKRSKREFRGRRDRDRCLLEARALQRLGEHPGVLRFERAWQEEGHFCLQTELCELGTLKDFLERLPIRADIPDAAVWQVLHDVGQALRHVHGMQLVHLDVKPANLLIGDEGGRLKLADFGMATAYGKGVDGIGDGQEGDTLYMAKELLSSTERLPSADMFSLGLTVYEVATRTELPGDGEDWHAMRDGRASGLPTSRSRELGALVRQLMHPDPAKRPTAESLCKHPKIAAIAASDYVRDDYVVSQAREWRAAEAAAMDHPSNGLRTPTGDMSARYIFQQTG